jgi:NitT/TauT family transport system permease protein
MKPWMIALLQRLVAPTCSLLLLLLVWAVAVQFSGVQTFLFPSPVQVGQAFWQQRQVLLLACGLTGGAALAGLALSILIGTLVAVLFSQSNWLRYGFYPYAIFLQTVPIVAIAPLLVMWFGYGPRGVIAVAFILSLFPIIANATAGMISVPRGLEELFRLGKASRWQRLVKLQLPHALPHLVTGVKTSSGLSVIGAIVGEFFVGYGGEGFGLGYLIRSWAESYRTDALFAAVFLSALLGVLIFAAVGLTAEKCFSRWSLP